MEKKSLYILTGASKGLGQALKNALIKKSGSKYSPEIVNLVVDLIDSEDERLLKILDIGV